MTLEQFYKGKRIFLTGHTGFKGSWLSAVLTDMGAEVKGYALAPNTNPSLYELLGLEKATQSVIGNILDWLKIILHLIVMLKE